MMKLLLDFRAVVSVNFLISADLTALSNAVTPFRELSSDYGIVSICRITSKGVLQLRSGSRTDPENSPNLNAKLSYKSTPKS